MLVLLFFLWVLLCGQWTAEVLLTGAVVSLLIYCFSCAFLGFSPRREFRLLRRLPGLILYIVYLLGQIFSSAMATVRLIWSPRYDPEPCLTGLDTELKTTAGQVILANSITLTPGTITVEVNRGHYLVHCLDTSLKKGLRQSGMERRVRRLEEGEG